MLLISSTMCVLLSFSIAAWMQLIDDKFDMLIHSPLARAAQTAEIVWADRTGPIHVLPSLREIDLYSFQVFHAIPAFMLKHLLQVFLMSLPSCLSTRLSILHFLQPGFGAPLLGRGVLSVATPAHA